MEKGVLKSFLVFSFIIIIFSLLFKSVYVFANPINDTATNITSDTDLNLTIGFSGFVSGKIIAGEGNRSNLTILETWADGEWFNSPVWYQVNVTQNNDYFHIHNATINNKILELTANATNPLSSGASSVLFLDTNYSIPNTTGIVARWWQTQPDLELGSGGIDVGLCFVEKRVTGNLTGSAANHCGNSGASYNNFKTDINNNEAWVEMTAWMNSTHRRLVVNYTNGGFTDGGILQKSGSASGDIESGYFMFYVQSAGLTLTGRFTNFTVANLTDFGMTQPVNFTPTTIQTNTQNSVILSVKISNQTIINRGSKALYYVFDATHTNLQSVVEGDWNVLGTSITGVGMNMSLFPNSLYSVSEFNSFLMEFDLDVTPPFVDFGLNSESNGSFLNRNWVFLNFSYTELNNDTFTIHNGTTNWINVNATSSYFFYNFTSLPNGNFTFFGSMNDTAGNRNMTINRTIVIDTIVPSVFGNSSLATTVNTAGNISVNVSDTGSNISSVTLEVTNDTGSNGDRVNYSMTFISGSNAAGATSVWSRSYTSGGERVFAARFWAEDFAGNVYKTPDGTLEWSASSPSSPPAPSGGGGGGGGSNCKEGEYFNLTKGKCIPSNITVILGGNETWKLTPSRVDSPHIPLSWFSKNESKYSVVIRSNRLVDSCDVLSGNFSCLVVDGSALQVSKFYVNENYFSKVDKGQLRVSQNGNIKFLDVDVKIFNPAFSIRFGSVVNPLKQFPTLSVAGVVPNDGLSGVFSARRGGALEVRIIPLLLILTVVTTLLWRLGKLKGLQRFLNTNFYKPFKQVVSSMAGKRFFSSKKGQTMIPPIFNLVNLIFSIKFKKSALKRASWIIGVLSLLLMVVIVFAGAGNFNPSGDSNLTIVPYTHPNNTFMNRTWAFLNFTVDNATGVLIDTFNVNLTSTASGSSAFNSFNGMNSTVWDKDLVGVWHLDENGSTSGYADSSGNENNGTPNNGVSNVTGRLGGAASFDGVNDFVSMGNPASLNATTGSWTVAAWMKLTNSSSAYEYPLYKGGDGNVAAGYSFYIVTGTGATYFSISSGDGNPYQTSPNAGNILDGTWHFLVGIIDRGAGRLRIYKDGAQVGTGTDISAYTKGVNGSTSFTISRSTYTANGSIDEVKIWKRVLSAAEVSAEYNRTASNYLTSHAVSGNVHTFSLNMTNLSQGNYSWFAWVNDSASNVADTQSTPRFLTVDTFAPAIQFVDNTPANNSFLPTNYILINTSHNDAGSDHNDYSAFVDFNNSLVGYWRFEDDGDTNASDFTSNNNNGTLVGFGCTTLDCNSSSGWVSNGKRGKVLSFDGKNDYVVDVQDIAIPANGTATLEAWVYFAMTASERGSNPDLYSNGIFSNNTFPLLYQHPANDLMYTNGVEYFNFKPQNKTWYHMALTYSGNTSTAKLYVNGNPYNVNIQAGTDTMPALSTFTIGYAKAYMNGSIDEVKVWNRALNASEINASYRAGAYRLFNNFTGLSDGNYSYQAFVVDAAGSINGTENRTFLVDTALPGIAFGAASELHNANLSRRWLFVNVTVSELYVKNVTVELWNTSATGTGRGLVNRTNFTNSQGVVDGSNVTFQINFTNLPLQSVGLPDDVYYFNATVYDLSENSISLAWRTVTVDPTVPLVDFGLNSDVNNSFKNVNWVFMNFSYTELNNHTFTIHNGTTNWINVNATSSYFFYNFTNLPDGNFTFFASINDTAGNKNVTTNRTIVIDRTSPNVNLTLPMNNSALVLTGNALNFSVSDLYLNNSWYRLVDKFDNSVEIDNLSLANFANTTFNVLNYHSFTLTLFVNDKSGNINSTSVELITNAPSAPANGGADNKGGGGGGGSGSGLTVDLMCEELKSVLEFRKGLLLESDYSYVQQRIYDNTSKNVTIGLLKNAAFDFKLYCPHLTLDYGSENVLKDFLSVATNVTRNVTVFKRVNDSLIIPSAGISIPLFRSVPLAFLILPADINVGMPSEGWISILRFFFSLEYADFEQTSVVVTGTQLWVYVVLSLAFGGVLVTNKVKRGSYTKFTKKQKHSISQIVGKKVGAMRNSSTANAK